MIVDGRDCLRFELTSSVHNTPRLPNLFRLYRLSDSQLYRLFFCNLSPPQTTIHKHRSILNCITMPSGIEQAIQYIKTNWKQGKTLKEIAQIHRVDPGNLARAFRAKEGTTVKAFVDEKRKQYVLQTIKDSNPFAYEIGAELGFSNDLAFYRWVKRAFGIPFAQLRSRPLDKKG